MAATPEELEQAGFPAQAAQERQRRTATPPVPPGTPPDQVEEEARLRALYPTHYNPDGSSKY